MAKAARRVHMEWTEEDTDLLAANAGWIGASQLAVMLGHPIYIIKAKAKAANIDLTLRYQKPEIADGTTRWLPGDTKQFKTRKGALVLRIPCAEQGIVSRTVHITDDPIGDDEEEMPTINDGASRLVSAWGQAVC